MLMNKDDVDTPAGLQRWLLGRIRQAGQEIMLAPGHFAFDAVGQLLLSELEYACVRTVQVRCLLDPVAASAFIHEHPALLTELETPFRIRQARVDSVASVIIFDRKLALVGDYALTETGNAQTASHNRIVTQADELGSLADRFDALWAEAQQCPPTKSGPE